MSIRGKLHLLIIASAKVFIRNVIWVFAWGLIALSIPIKASLVVSEKIERARSQVLDQLRKAIPLDADLLRVEKIFLKERCAQSEDDSLKKRFTILIERLKSPQELIIYKEKEDLIVCLLTSGEQQDAYERLSKHKAFDALNKLIEELCTLLEALSEAETKESLRRILDVYNGYIKILIASPKDVLKLLEPKPGLLGTYLSPNTLEGEVAHRLISRDRLDFRIKQNQTGGHSVSAYGGLHFKVYDEEMKLFPGRELAMHHLYVLVVGEGVTPTMLFCIEDIPIFQADRSNQIKREINQAYWDKKDLGELRIKNPQIDRVIDVHTKKKSYPVQAAISVKGVGFDEFLERVAFADWLLRGTNKNSPMDYLTSNLDTSFTNRFLIHDNTFKGTNIDKKAWDDFIKNFDPADWSYDRLDKETVAKMVLMSFITEPDDARADNFMVYKDKQTNTWKLISIDTDRALEPGITKIIRPPHPAKHVVEHKSIFYLFPEIMKISIPQLVKELFVHMNPPLVLAKWLRYLEAENVAYSRLKKQSSVPEKVFDEMSLPIGLKKGKIIFLLEHLEKLQKIVKEKYDSSLTLDYVFKLLHPVLHSYYKKMTESCLASVPQNERKPFHYVRVFEKICENHTSEKSLQSCMGDDLFAIDPVTKLSVHDLLRRYNEVHLDINSDKSSLDGDYRSLENAFHEIGEELEKRKQESLHKQSLREEYSQKESILNLQELILAEGCSNTSSMREKCEQVDLLKRVICLQNPQLVDAGLGRNFYQRCLRPSGLLQKDKDVEGMWLELLRRNSKLRWYVGIEDFFLADKERSKGDYVAFGCSEGEKYFSKEIWGQLINDKNQFRKINADGAHVVGRAARNNVTFYFKMFPKLPGLEEAVGRLTRQLIGFGAPHTELFKIDDKPFLVSQEVKGLTLKETIRRHPERLKYIDPESLGNLLLVSMIIHPEDGNASNYIMEEIAPQSYRLVGIDNDQAFVPAIAKLQKTGLLSNKHQVQVKCILYCLDQIKERIHNNVRQRFRAINPRKELQKWLDEIDMVHARHVALFDQNQQKKLFEDRGCFLGVAFKKGDLHEIYDRIIRLQEGLSDPAVITYQDLLLRIDYELGCRYRNYLASPACPENVYERFKGLEGAFYDQSMGTITTSAQVLDAQGIPEKELLQDIIRKEHYYTPKKALEELKERVRVWADREALTTLDALESNLDALQSEEFRVKTFATLDFNNARQKKEGEGYVYESVPIHVQKALLRRLQDFNHYVFTLKNCSAFRTDLFLNGSFNIGHLTQLSLRGCDGVTNDLVVKLPKTSPGLVTMDLSGSKKLTKFSRPFSFGSFAYVEYLLLRTLILDECPNLSELFLIGTSLKLLSMRDNPNFIDLGLQCSLLETIHLDGATKITAKSLEPLAKTCPRLNKITCLGCSLLVVYAARQYDTSLNLGVSKVEDALARELGTHTTPTSLDLEGAEDGDDVARAFAVNTPRTNTQASYDLQSEFAKEEEKVRVDVTTGSTLKSQDTEITLPEGEKKRLIDSKIKQARELIKQEKYQEAIDLIEGIAEQQEIEMNADLWSVLARCYSALPSTKKDLVKKRLYLERYISALEATRTVRNPLVKTVGNEEEKGIVDVALSSSFKRLETEVTSAEAEKKLLIDSKIKQARELIRQEKYQEAIDLMEGIAEQQEIEIDAALWYLLASCYGALPRTEKNLVKKRLYLERYISTAEKK